LDKFESMTVFVTVADEGGFSAAARRLGMPLATVSRKVTELEESLKLRLINRTTRWIALTEGGAAFLASARQILETLHEAERVATGEYAEPRGGLTITAPIVFGRLHVLPIVTEFLRAHPQVEVRLLLMDRVVNLLEEQIDLSVRIGELAESSLMAVRLGSIRQVVVASPAYLRAHGRPNHPDELIAHDGVVFATEGSGKAMTFRINHENRSVPVRSRLTVTTAEAAIDAAIADAGITQVRCYQVIDAIDRGKLELVLRSFETDEAPLSFVYPSGRLIPLKLRAFLDFAAPRIKARMRVF